MPGSRIKSEASLAGHTAPGSGCSGQDVSLLLQWADGLIFTSDINASHLPAYSDTLFTAAKDGLKWRSFEKAFFFIFFACSTVQYFSNKADDSESL